MKKQIAVLMAAATAVTTVAPALANADVTEYYSADNEVLSAVKKALDTKYKDKNSDGFTDGSAGNLSDDYLNSRYMVLVNNCIKNSDEEYVFDKLADTKYNGVFDLSEIETYKDKGEKQTWYVVDNTSDLSKILETKPGTVVAIVDKGATDNGESYRTTKFKHYVSSNKVDGEGNFEASKSKEQVALPQAAKELFDLARPDTEDGKKKATFVESLKVFGGNFSVDGEFVVKSKTQQVSSPNFADITKIELELVSGKKFTLKFGSDALNFAKPVDGDQEIKGDDINKQNVLDDVDGFKLIDNDDENDVDVDVPTGDITVYISDNVMQKVIKLDNIYTRANGYTDRGADFVNSIRTANEILKDSTKDDKDATFNFDGTNYQLANQINFGEAKIEKVSNGYKLSFKVDAYDTSDEIKEDNKDVIKFEITGAQQKDLADILRDLKGGNDVVAGHFTKLIGSNRYETAIEVSGEQFEKGEADTVVIVGGRAQMDGLAAAPLAAAKKAPILLADPNSGLSDATLKEMDRAVSDLYKKTVYIVGGEKSVPKSVVKQIEDKFGAVVVRISGSDRMATSREVAQKLIDDDQVNGKRVFLVGAEGAADAMSVAPVASKFDDSTSKRKVDPILVVNKKGLSKDDRKKIDATKATTAYLIGGVGSLSTDIVRDLGKTSAKKTINRVAGSDRYATNVEVIKTFYKNENGGKPTDGTLVEGVLVTSGDNKYLVDAQTSGAYAAEKNYAILLTGSKLTNDQQKLFKNDGRLSKLNTNVYQVGGVVSSDVMKYIVEKLDL